MKSPAAIEAVLCDDVCSNSGVPKATCGGVETPLDPFRIVVRHGALPAALSLLSAVQINALSSVSPEHLNEIVPDEFDRDFYVDHPVQAIAPSSKMNVEHLAERAYRWIDQLLHNASDRAYDFQFNRDHPDAWKIHVPPAEAHLLRPLFPISIESVNVVLIDRPAAVFEALR